MNIRDQLIKHEAERLNLYKCSAGKNTIGVGHNVDDLGLSKAEILELLKYGITKEFSDYLLDNDIARVKEDCKQFKWFDHITDTRQKVIIDMIFNMGITTFREFKKMILALEDSDFIEAAAQMKDSKWYGQVKTRGETLHKMMLEG